MRARFQRQIDALERIFSFVETFFEAENLEPRYRPAIDLALEEVFTNMVRHNPDGNGDILITLDRRDDEIVLSLTDSDARDFDPTKRKDVDINLPLDQREPGGLGVHLIRKMMDRVEYVTKDREGTITMTKRMI